MLTQPPEVSQTCQNAQNSENTTGLWVPDVCMNTVTGQPAVAQLRKAEHGREICLVTFSKVNISNQQSDEIK